MPSYNESVALSATAGLSDIPVLSANPSLTLASVAAFADKITSDVVLTVKAKIKFIAQMKDKRALGLNVFLTYF